MESQNHLQSTTQSLRQLDHECPHCHQHYVDDCLPDGVISMVETRSKVILYAGIVASVGPLLLGLLSFISSWFGKTWVPDDKILYAYLGAFGAIIAWAWKTQQNGK